MIEIKNLKIEKMVFRGYGLGFHNSSPIFVRNCVAGDIVDVQIIHKKKDVQFADVIKVVEASTARVKPMCAEFETCGGCDWQQIDYPMQLKFKEDIIREIFGRIHPEIIEIQASPKINGYRNKMFLPVSIESGIPIAGMFAKQSHRVVPHFNCNLQPEFFDELVEDILKYMKAAKVSVYDEKSGKGLVRHIGIRYGFNTDDLMVVLVTKSRKLPFSNQLIRILTDKYPNLKGIVLNINPTNTNVILGNDEKIIYGENSITEKIGEKLYKIHYRSFFQVNSGLTEKLYEFVKEQVKAGDKVIDAFSGAGTIGIYLSDRAEKVFCIESNTNAHADAKHNGEVNKAKNCEFICGNVEDVLPQLVVKEEPDLIVFDPPRKGLEADTIEKIALIPKIVYVSCNAMTQKRDIERLLKRGYKIKLIKPFDMFPHTYHMENVIVLEK